MRISKLYLRNLIREQLCKVTNIAESYDWSFKYRTITIDSYSNKLFFSVYDGIGNETHFNVSTWLKSPLPDKSNPKMKARMLMSIIKSQTNRDLVFNYIAWVKNTRPTFEEKLRYMIDTKMLDIRDSASGIKNKQ